MMIMGFIARAGLPFNIVNEPSFKELVQFLNPRANVKSSTTFSKQKLPLLYECVMGTAHKLIAAEVPACDQVAFTTDCWTSRAGDPYITLTLHYINDAFEQRKFVLNFENFQGRHTSKYIGHKLTEMINEIPELAAVKSKVVVHDAAANMKALFNRQQNNLPAEMESLLCADHLLHTSLMHAANAVTEVKQAIAVATDLASNVRRSNLSDQLIMSECIALGEEYAKIISPVATRWNSRCMMISSIIRLKKVLVSLRDKPEQNLLTDLIPGDATFSVLEAILPILEVMRNVSERCSAEDKPVIGDMLQILANLPGILHQIIQKVINFR